MPSPRLEAVSQNGTVPMPLLRAAAAYKWENPDATWPEVAKAIGRSRQQLLRYRHTEEWEVTFREAGQAHVDKLAPHAVAALLRAWRKGNPAGAIDVLRSFGFLRSERLEISAEINEQQGQAIAETFRRIIFAPSLPLSDDLRERMLQEALAALPA
jgi:hypothetical protein